MPVCVDGDVEDLCQDDHSKYGHEHQDQSKTRPLPLLAHPVDLPLRNSHQAHPATLAETHSDNRKTAQVTDRLILIFSQFQGPLQTANVLFAFYFLHSVIFPFCRIKPKRLHVSDHTLTRVWLLIPITKLSFSSHGYATLGIRHGKCAFKPFGWLSVSPVRMSV